MVAAPFGIDIVEVLITGHHRIDQADQRSSLYIILELRFFLFPLHSLRVGGWSISHGDAPVKFLIYL